MEHSIVYSSSSSLVKKGKRFKASTAIFGLDALVSVAEIQKRENHAQLKREKRQREKQKREIRIQELVEMRKRVKTEERKILLKESRENDNLIAALTRFYVGSMVSSMESIDTVGFGDIVNWLKSSELLVYQNDTETERQPISLITLTDHERNDESVVSSMLTTNLVQDDANCVHSAKEKIKLIISELLHPDAIKRCLVKLDDYDSNSLVHLIYALL